MRHIFTAKSAAILGLWCFTRRRTATRPSKCGTHGGRKAAHMAPHFQVPLRRVCCILFDVYRTYCTYIRTLVIVTVHFWVDISPASSYAIINPRRACAARVTVVVLCVCMCVCVCVHSYLPPRTLESQRRDTNRFIAIQGSF